MDQPINRVLLLPRHGEIRTADQQREPLQVHSQARHRLLNLRGLPHVGERLGDLRSLVGLARIVVMQKPGHEHLQGFAFGIAQANRNDEGQMRHLQAVAESVIANIQQAVTLM